MLFLIGLELEPALLWRLRVPILGLGGLQVGVTAVVFAIAALVLGQSWQISLAVGLILAQSSTAIVLQTLNEKGLMKTEAGQSAFSVLLFQDIAVIPILALLPLLGTKKLEAVSLLAFSGNGSMIAAATETSTRPGWQQALLVMLAVGGIIVAGRFLMRPVFRFIASTRLQEIFTATALLLVIGIALVMEKVGLSAALGTFVAGVVLADNEYRHELETNIAPFKGLLLGLFFISVGAGIDFQLIIHNPIQIGALVGGLAIAKFAVLLILGKFFKLELSQNLLFAFALAQGGEFGFVLFSFATKNYVLPSTVTEPLVATVALSMALTPLIMILNDKLVQPRFTKLTPPQEADAIDDHENPVIIAGFGRFGQIVGRLLFANGYKATVLDHDPTQIEMLRRFGFKVFYGDSSRIDLLRAAGAEQAKLFVVAIDEIERSLVTIDLVQKHFPHLKILARAIDRRHAYKLIQRHVDVVERETFGSALDLGVEALKLLGMRSYKALRAARLFKYHDEEALHEIAEQMGDEKFTVTRSRQLAETLEDLLRSDDRDLGHESDRSWDIAAQVGKEKAEE